MSSAFDWHETILAWRFNSRINNYVTSGMLFGLKCILLYLIVFDDRVSKQRRLVFPMFCWCSLCIPTVRKEFSKSSAHYCRTRTATWHRPSWTNCNTPIKSSRKRCAWIRLCRIWLVDQRQTSLLVREFSLVSDKYVLKIIINSQIMWSSRRVLKSRYPSFMSNETQPFGDRMQMHSIRITFCRRTSAASTSTRIWPSALANGIALATSTETCPCECSCAGWYGISGFPRKCEWRTWSMGCVSRWSCSMVIWWRFIGGKLTRDIREDMVKSRKL